MANLYGFGSNQGMINQLIRQKESIDNLINQYSQPQQPIQNIINTTGTEFEARILKEDEEIDNILTTKRTMFLDKANKKLLIKEVDGKISEEYEIVIPLDEKDKKINDLEAKLKEMEERFNEYSKFVKPDDGKFKSYENANGDTNTTTETISKPISKSTK